MDKLLVTHKKDKKVTMTIRLDLELQQQFDDLAAKTNRARNEVICMPLTYAINHMEIEDK
mgnify:CR=1 FL=1